MITRTMYMASSSALHQRFYQQYADHIGFKWVDPADIQRFREALRTDEALNNIPLGWWEGKATRVWELHGRELSALAKRLGTTYAPLGDGVCMLKAAARTAVANADCRMTLITDGDGVLWNNCNACAQLWSEELTSQYLPNRCPRKKLLGEGNA